MPTAAPTLRDRREALVREHMESENRQQFAGTLCTFGHPRYELIATGEVYDGTEEVSRYYAASRAGLPRSAQPDPRHPPRRGCGHRRVRPPRHPLGAAA